MFEDPEAPALTPVEFKFLVKALATCLQANPSAVALEAVKDMTADEWDGLLRKCGLLVEEGK